VLVSVRHKFAFVHVPRTGGTSVEAALSGAIGCDSGGMLGHTTAWSARDILASRGNTAWDRYFTCGFVRNPWERMVSYHCHTLTNRWSGARQITFENFLGIGDGWRGKEQQATFLCGHDDRPLVTFVGRYERIEEDYGVVCRHLGIDPPPLRRLNASVHGDYRDYYNAGTQATVARQHARDIEIFGYRF
jgi:sulfotransferase famil protein